MPITYGNNFAGGPVYNLPPLGRVVIIIYPIFLRKIGLFLFQVQCLGTRHRFVSLFMFVFILGHFSFASFPYNNNQHDDNYADFRYQKKALPNEFLHGVLLSVLGIISETTGKTLAPI